MAPWISIIRIDSSSPPARTLFMAFLVRIPRPTRAGGSVTVSNLWDMH